jgi:hypothetical protein
VICDNTLCAVCDICNWLLLVLSLQVHITVYFSMLFIVALIISKYTNELGAMQYAIYIFRCDALKRCVPLDSDRYVKEIIN